MTHEDSLKVNLPPSPHIESYKRFRANLTSEIEARLREMLLSLHRDNLINFEPAITVTTEKVRFDHPTKEEEQECFRKNRSLQRPFEILLKLSESTGYNSWFLGFLPDITSRGSFIFSGKERALEKCPVAQLNESPGLMFWKERMEYLKYGLLRPEKGKPFVLRKAGDRPIQIRFATGKYVRLRTLLDALGYSDEKRCKLFEGAPELVLDEQRIGTQSYGKGPIKSDISYAARCMGLGKWLEEQKLSIGDRGKEEIRGKVKASLFATRLGKLGRLQINRRIRRIENRYGQDSDLLTAKDFEGIIKYFLVFINGAMPEDDIWDLGNLKVRLVGDYLAIAVERWFSLMTQRVKRMLAEKAPVGPDALIQTLREANESTQRNTRFSSEIYDWLRDSPLSQLIMEERNNLFETADLTQRITFNGGGRWGGIKIGHERLPRYFHPSHIGRLCPLDTPQNADVGVTLTLTVGARVNDAGIIETPCHKVIHADGSCKVDKEEVWLSPWDEEDIWLAGRQWVAFPDYRNALLTGKEVQAHRACSNMYECIGTVDAPSVAFIHASIMGMYSPIANLIPFRNTNDSVRGVYACSFIKQALPLEKSSLPAVATGFEKAIPEAYPFECGVLPDGREMCFGTELCVAYMPWKGWNFEDALVISASAAQKLSSIHRSSIFVKLRTSMEGQKRSFASIKDHFGESVDLSNYDDRGIIKSGQYVYENQLLVLEGVIRKKQGASEVRLVNHALGNGRRGLVKSIEDVSGGDGQVYLRFIIEDVRPGQIGDKLANRHGHKGIISKIYPDHEMPYFCLASKAKEKGSPCICGELRPHKHIQMLINPLSVISRMNLGQLHETAKVTNPEMNELSSKLDCYDPSKPDEDKKLLNPVFVGDQYIMKLDHNAEEKLHGRSREPGAYSAFVEQPLKGKRMKGGQRLGEMEVWALMAHNASPLMKELLTVKSDNPRERELLFQSLVSKVGLTINSGLPEAFRTFSALCLGLGLNISLASGDREVGYPFFQRTSPEDVNAVKINILDSKRFKDTISKGEINTPVINGKSFNGYHCRFHPDGLESERIFGPTKNFSCACGRHVRDYSALGKRLVCKICGTPLERSSQRRWRMGHISLVLPVPNTLFILSIGEMLQPYIGLDKFQTQLLLEDRASLRFKTWFDARQFFTTALRGSRVFRQGLEDKLNGRFMEDKDQEGFLRGLFIAFDTEDGDCSIESFWNDARDFYGSEILSGLGGLAQTIIRERQICGIDLLIEMLGVNEETRCFVTEVIPVIPPDLRKAFQISGTKIKPHDLNKLYQSLLRANEEMREALESAKAGLAYTDYAVLRKKLQKAVSQLLCNQKLSRRDQARDYSIAGYPILRSISSFIEGKDGVIVGNLLGKRVDFSGRAVISPDPTLDLNKCELPLNLAAKVFYPHLLAVLNAESGTLAQDLIDDTLVGEPETNAMVISELRDIVQNHPVILNRQPTLHRLGVLGFNASLGGKGSVIAIPPLVTTGFNADFDGDQMAIYLPITGPAQEAIPEIFPSQHLWHPADGTLALNLSQDIALGGYLKGLGSRNIVARSFENRVKEHDLTESIQRFASDAFEAVTNEGLSFDTEDLLAMADEFDENVATLTRSDVKKQDLNQTQIMKQFITNSTRFDAFRKIIESGARGNWETLVYLAGRVNQDRQFSNLSKGLTIGEEFLQAILGRENLVEGKLGTAEGGALTKDLVAIGEGIWIRGKSCGAENGISVGPYRSWWEHYSMPKEGDQTEKRQPPLVNMLDIIELLIRKRHGHDTQIREILISDMTAGHLGLFTKQAFLEYATQSSPVEVVEPEPKPSYILAVRCWQGVAKDVLEDELFGRVLSRDLGSYERGTYVDRDLAASIADFLISNNTFAFVRSPITCQTQSGVCGHCYGLPATRGRGLRGWNEKDLAPIDTRVGIIAAQAIGERGTQMFLKKKHVFSVIGQDDHASLNVQRIRNNFSRGKVLTRSIRPYYFTEDEFQKTQDLHILRCDIEKALGDSHLVKSNALHGFYPNWLREDIAWLNQILQVSDLDVRLREPSRCRIPDNDICMEAVVGKSVSVEFSVREFTPPYNLRNLRKALGDGVRLSHIRGNGIKWFTEVLKMSDLYERSCKDKDVYPFSTSVEQLAGRVKSLTDTDQDQRPEEKILKRLLNRLVIEQLFPDKTPKLLTKLFFSLDPVERQEIVRRNRLMLEEMFPLAPKSEDWDPYRRIVDDVATIYRQYGLSVSPVHYETLFRGLIEDFKKRKSQEYGWVAIAAHPDKVLDIDAASCLVRAGWNKQKDMLGGLKEHAFMGKTLPVGGK